MSDNNVGISICVAIANLVAMLVLKRIKVTDGANWSAPLGAGIAQLLKKHIIETMRDPRWRYRALTWIGAPLQSPHEPLRHTIVDDIPGVKQTLLLQDESWVVNPCESCIEEILWGYAIPLVFYKQGDCTCNRSGITNGCIHPCCNPLPGEKTMQYGKKLRISSKSYTDGSVFEINHTICTKCNCYLYPATDGNTMEPGRRTCECRIGCKSFIDAPFAIQTPNNCTVARLVTRCGREVFANKRSKNGDRLLNSLGIRIINRIQNDGVDPIYNFCEECLMKTWCNQHGPQNPNNGFVGCRICYFKCK